jgi:hypothetical protein
MVKHRVGVEVEVEGMPTLSDTPEAVLFKVAPAEAVAAL